MRFRPSVILLALASFPVAALLSGCGAGFTDVGTGVNDKAVTMQGTVHGGQSPLVGAHIYLMRLNTTGNGGSGVAAATTNASVSVLNAGSTGTSDTLGAYVLSGPGGAFTITGDYTCNSSFTYYLYVTGGDSGAGNNSAVGLMAGLGSCPTGSTTFAGVDPFITINEVSTVATAYAMAGYATDATHISSANTLLGLLNSYAASLNIANLENLATGNALTTTPGGNGTVPQAQIDTIANILAACINSPGVGSTACVTLFANAKSGGSTGTTATDTATAAINIAHNPGTNVGTLFGVIVGTPAFVPTLSTAPNDYTIGIGFTAPGSGNSTIRSLAVDSFGSVWATDTGRGRLYKFATTGTVQTITPTAAALGVAIDPSGNAWVTEGNANAVEEFSSSGVSAGQFTGGGLIFPDVIAIDGNGNIFTTGYSNFSKFNNSGVAQSGTGGYGPTMTGLYDSIAIDSLNNVWLADAGDGVIDKFSNSGVSAGTFTPQSHHAYFLAIDNANNVWATDFSELDKLSNSGAFSGSGFTGGGGGQFINPLAMDGAGDVWMTDANANVSEFSNAGVALSPATGFQPAGAAATYPIAVDGAGNVWAGNFNVNTVSVVEMIGAAVPTYTPLSLAIAAGKLGARP